MLSTASKLKLARVARRVVGVMLAARRVDPSHVVCSRRGVRWDLDLDEGIQLAIFLEIYEPSTYRVLASLVSDDAVVIDVGANVGAHALPLSRRLRGSGRVIAVEPTDSAMARLRQNRELNPDLVETLTLSHCALGDGSEHAAWFYSRWPLQSAAGRHPVHGGEPQASTATQITLDALVEELRLSRVDLIKLDVDGHELPVLAGASETLKRHRPRIVLEVCPYLLAERGATVEALVEPLFDLGYSLYAESDLSRLGAVQDWANAIPKGGSINVVAAATPPASVRR